MSFERPYLDSSVYIAAIKNEPGRGDIARAILQDAEKGRIRVCASTFVIAEVLKAPGYEQLSVKEEETIADFFLHDFFDWADLDMVLARKARSLARECSLKPADAVHLATAIELRADCFLKWDRHFGDGVCRGLRVCEPYALDRQEELNLAAATTATGDPE